MFRLLKALPFTLALAALSFFTTSCGSSSSQVRVVDAIPDAPVSFDVAINGKNVFTGVSFESIEPASGYQKISSGSATVEVFQTGTTTAVIPSTSFSLSASSQYTVIATGFYSATQPPNVPTAVQFTDNNSAPTSGNVEFRIIHASPSSPTVDVYIVPPGTDITQVNPPTISGLTYQQASTYQSLAAATYSVIVTTSGSKQEIIFPQDYGLTAGQIRTLVLVDNPGGGNPPSWMLLSDLN